MIAVILPSVILEIVSTYILITMAKGNMISWLTLIDFCIWNSFLSVPKMYAIYVASKAAKNGKALNNVIGKYANVSNDLLSLQMVS